MSNFAPATPVPTKVPGMLLPYNEATAKAYGDSEQRRFGKPRQRAIVKQSQSMSVYVYTVGPFPFSRSCASLGSRYFPALDKSKILLPNDYSVAFCFTVEGMPAEPVPGNQRNGWLEHEPVSYIGIEDPAKSVCEYCNGSGQRSASDGVQRCEDCNGTGIRVLMFTEFPGYDQALRIIGAHPQSRKDVNGGPGADDLRPRGVFVSMIPEQIKPEMPEALPDGSSARAAVDHERAMVKYEAAMDLYRQWTDSVSTAREFLRKWIVAKLEDAREKYNRGQFVEIREDMLFELGKLVKQSGIDIECPWLKDTSEASGTVPCRFCGSSIPNRIPEADRKCAGCGEWQSDTRRTNKGR